MGSGETLILGDDDGRLADIIEGGSWSSMESDPVNGNYSVYNCANLQNYWTDSYAAFAIMI